MVQENENQKEEQTTSAEEVVNTEVQKYTDARALLADGFASIISAARLVGDHPEADRIWKGASIPTALAWKMEETIEGLGAMIDACEAFDTQGDKYVRADHQIEIADAILDGVGIDTMLLGCFGADKLREFANHYVGQQEARNRKPGFWYGPIYRAIGNIAYGVHVVDTADPEHAKLQAKPRNRAMFVRNMLMGKSQKREWDTVTIPKPKPKAAHVVLTATCDFNNLVTIGVALSGLSTDNFNLTMDALFDTAFQADYVYGALAKGAKPGLKGKKLSHFGNFRTLVKKALVDKTGDVAFRFKLKGSKASNWMTTTAKIKKLKAGDYTIEVLQ
jgi:hypothetical protein